MEAKYKYILMSNDTGERLQLRDAPVGWDATKFRLVRDLTYFGILKSISVEFEFVGDGFDFMQRQRLQYGIDADVIIRVYKKNPNEFLFQGKVNQENYLEDRKFNKYKVDIIQSSFVQSFQNREDVKLNILNNISLDRVPVTPAAATLATIRGKQIQFYSKFEGSANFEGGETFSYHLYHHTLPFFRKENGNPNVNPEGFYNVYLDEWNPTTEDNPLIVKENAVYENRLPEAQTPVIPWRVAGNLIYKGTYIVDPDAVFTRFRILLVNQDNTVADSLFIHDIHVVEFAPGGGPLPSPSNNPFDFSGTLNPTVEPGQYIVFLMERWKDDEPNDLFEMEVAYPPALAGAYRMEQYYTTLDLEITDNSTITDTSHPVILPHEVFTNLIQQINGGEFYSEFFGRVDIGYDADGDGAFLALTKGELLRGIPLDDIQFAMSFREAFSSYSSVFCLGALLTDEYIQVEPLDRLFNHNITAALGEVNELAISPTKEFLFNSVKAGYPPNEYEEQNGRDEFNTPYQYTNSLKAVKKELDISSKFYGDGYGIEFARRQSVITTGTKDSKYDSQIFFIDLVKDIDGNLMSRRNEDILFVDGIFSPETAINLMIAVGQNLLRWRKYLNVPLHKKPKKYYFQSKEKNAGLELVTALGATVDGQDIETGTAVYFLPEQHTFKCPITIELLFAIVANPLGIVSYTYNGEKFFDYVFEVDAETDKGIGQFRMLGTKETPVEVAEDVAQGNYLKYNDGLTDYVKYGNGADDILLYQ